MREISHVVNTNITTKNLFYSLSMLAEMMIEKLFKATHIYKAIESLKFQFEFSRILD